MTSSINDLMYKYFLTNVGINGLSLDDLKYLFYLNGGPIGQAPNIPHDPTAVDTLYTPAPTISVAAWADPGANYTLVPSDLTGTNFQYRGATDFQFGGAFPDTIMALPTSRYPHLYTSPQGIWSVEFMTDASEIKLYFKDSSAAATYRLKVNGKRLTDLPQATGGTGSGGRRLLTIDFGSAAVRRVCLEFATVPFAGIYVLKPGSIWKPGPYFDKVIFTGDSTFGGSAMNTGSGQGMWIARLAEMLGIQDPWNSSIGSTGYLVRTASNTNNMLDRIYADTLVYNPSKIVLGGGYNDNASPIADVTANINAVGRLIAAEAPQAKVYVVGPWSPVGPAAAGTIAVNNAVKNMANANGWPFIDQLTGNVTKGDVTLLTGTQWITGTGNTGAPAGNGNADIYIGTDTTHGNDACQKYIADRMYRALIAAGW